MIGHNLYLTISIFLFVGLTRVVVSEAKSDDLLWFEGFKLPKNNPLTFVNEDENFDNEWPQLDTQQVDLNEKIMDPEEVELWNRLMNKTDDHHLNTYVILNKIYSKRKGENIRYHRIESNDIEALIKIKHLRVINCSIENMTKRMAKKFSPGVYNNSKLTAYIKHYSERQRQFCWDMNYTIFKGNIQEIPDKYKTTLQYIFSNASDIRFDLHKLSYDMSLEEKQLVKVIAKSMSYNTMMKRLADLPRLSFLRMLHSTLKLYRKLCYHIDISVTPFIRILDLFFPKGSQERKDLKLDDNTLFWTASWYICENIMNNREFQEKLWIKFSKLVKVQTGPSSKEEHSLLVELDESSKFMGYVFGTAGRLLNRNPQAPRINLDRNRMRVCEQDSWGAVLIGEHTSNTFSQTKMHLDFLNKFYRNLKFEYKNFNQNNIESLISFSNINIDSCLTSSVITATKFATTTNLNVYSWLNEFIEFYMNKRDKVCHKLIEELIAKNASSLQESTRAAMKSIPIENKLLDPSIDDINTPLIYNAVASIAWYNGEYEKKLASNLDKLGETYREILTDLLGKHCIFVEDSFGEISDHIDKIRDEIKLETILEPKSKHWLILTKICRAIMNRSSAFFENLPKPEWVSAD